MLIWLIGMVCIAKSNPTEITVQVFGSDTNVFPAAFGDFNSDELTDLFVLRNDRGDFVVEVLLGSNEDEPLLKSNDLKCSFKEHPITSVVPGDFNGDALMDVLVTVEKKGRSQVYVLWGGRGSDGRRVLNCSHHHLLELIGQPLALDYDNDFILDLYGVDVENRRSFWIFGGQEKGKPQQILAVQNSSDDIREPHSNAYLDLDDDYVADLFVTTKSKDGRYGFEIWHGTEKKEEPKFYFRQTVYPPGKVVKLGQSVFLDLELQGKLDHVVPIFNESKWNLFVYSRGLWHDLKVDFTDRKGTAWSFYEGEGRPFSGGAVTMRGGDYNMDGYPDLLATLVASSGTACRTFLFENKPCLYCGNFSRTFSIRWDGFSSPAVDDSVTGAFYDIFQDGILDVILVRGFSNDSYRVAAYKNNLDYDANFVKVMVLTGLTENHPRSTVSGKNKKTFGTNLPGPRISYKTIDQDGNTRTGLSAQIPQSAYHSLHLPYTTFALGRTPNFVDNITVGFASYYRDWPQVIPNSQMVVIPDPLNDPNKWKVQLFVTPSKAILMSGIALAGTCVFISAIIFILYWEERKVDRLERLQEAHRFHFDAM